jgi:hypothetical protein
MFHETHRGISLQRIEKMRGRVQTLRARNRRKKNLKRNSSAAENA